MERIDDIELDEIIKSYGFEDLAFDSFKQVEPDTALYFFHDKLNNEQYCLMVSDFPSDDIELPSVFKYDYYPDDVAEFEAIKKYSYITNAAKKADGYIDENHCLTVSNSGDVCMLFGVKMH